MIVLTLNNAHTHIECSEELKSVIWDLLSYEVPGADFVTRAHPNWNWDGRTRLFNKRTGQFPTGLLTKVTGHLESLDAKFKIVDRRPIASPEHRFKIKEGWVPREYQAKVVEKTGESARGVFVIGTGGGKTPTSMFIIQSKGVDTLFVTPDTGLREQTYQTYREMLEDPSMVSTNIKGDAPIVVSNIQSLIRQPACRLERFGCLMIDEFHHAGADSFLKLNQKASNAFYRYGFTGTFMRSDGTDMTMHGVLSDVLYAKSTSELIEEGWLVRPYITVLRHQVHGWSRLNYKQAYDRIIADTTFNTIISRIANEKLTEGKQTLILVRRKEHGELLHKMIEGSGYVNGDLPMWEREEVKEQFLKRELQCLIATNILGEGQDIPSIDVLINARLQKTEIQTAQGIGRALRKTEGKDKAEVFDFLIVGQRNLAAHSAERIISYRKEPAFKISIIRA